MTTAIVSGFWNEEEFLVELPEPPKDQKEFALWNEDNMAWVRRLLEMSEPIYPGTNDNDVA
jgi:hypothetical protein